MSTIKWSSCDWHTVNRPICALSNYIQSICLLRPIVTTVCNGNIGLSYYSFFSQFNNSQSVLRQFVYSQFVKWKPKNSIYLANPFTEQNFCFRSFDQKFVRPKILFSGQSSPNLKRCGRFENLAQSDRIRLRLNCNFNSSENRINGQPRRLQLLSDLNRSRDGSSVTSSRNKN